MVEPLPCHYLLPDWPAPSPVRAVSTTRGGGRSAAPFASFNLAAHVGDDPDAVAANRRRLMRELRLPDAPAWLNQVHGNTVVTAERPHTLTADASIAREAGRVCVVMTADCLPLLLCDREGGCVAAVHAGWRGLANGVVDASVARMGCSPAAILAWLGPAVGSTAFELGPEVRAVLLRRDAGATDCFQPSPAGRWLADIYGLARRQLRSAGVESIAGGHWCTYHDRERFFSYRRDGLTGRMATLIWLAP